MKITNPVYIALVYVFSFVLGYILSQVIFSHSDSKDAYSVMNAWWLTLYVGNVFGTNLRSLIFIFPVSAIVLTILYITGLGDSFYHGAPATLSSKLVIVVLMQSALIVSPLLVNLGINYLSKK